MPLLAPSARSMRMSMGAFFDRNNGFQRIVCAVVPELLGKIEDRRRASNDDFLWFCRRGQKYFLRHFNVVRDKRLFVTL